MLTVLSALVAAACVLASVRRLACAVQPTWLDPQLLTVAVRDGAAAGLDRAAAGASGVPSAPDWVGLRAAIAACEDATWEHDLLAALEASDEPSRVALVNEQLRELDWRAQRWARVPRVCASVATSAGFLFACVALIRAVALPNDDGSAALVSAVDALAIGMAGTSFCIAVHVRARHIVAERLAAAARFVDVLESCT
jgi:hypothetical protein